MSFGNFSLPLSLCAPHSSKYNSLCVCVCVWPHCIFSRGFYPMIEFVLKMRKTWTRWIKCCANHLRPHFLPRTNIRGVVFIKGACVCMYVCVCVHRRVNKSREPSERANAVTHLATSTPNMNNINVTRKQTVAG